MSGVESAQVSDRAGVEAARVEVRLAGYCVHCDRIVERTAGGGCPKGHPAAGVTGRVVLAPGEPVPELPRFNVAAFLLPPVWGPAHGQWEGAIFLPLWLFADSVLRTAGQSPATMVVASVVSVATIAAMSWFARRANGLAWRRVWDRVPVAVFVRRQRVWAVVSAPVAAALLGMALYYNLVIAPARAS